MPPMLLYSSLVARALTSELKHCDLSRTESSRVVHAFCTSHERAPTIRWGDDTHLCTSQECCSILLVRIYLEGYSQLWVLV